MQSSLWAALTQVGITCFSISTIRTCRCQRLLLIQTHRIALDNVLTLHCLRQNCTERGREREREEKNPSSWFKLFHYNDYAKQCTRVGRPECQFFHQHRTGIHCHTQWPAHWILLQNEKFSITISERFYCLPCAWKRRSQPIDP